MPNPTDSVYIRPTMPEQQSQVGFEYGSTSSQEYVDEQINETVADTNLKHKFQRQASIPGQIDNIKNIYEPRISQADIDKMLEEISAYLMQEGDLLDGYREHESASK